MPNLVMWTRAGEQGASCLPATTTYVPSLEQISSSEIPRNRSIFLPLLTHKKLVHFQREPKPAQIVHLFSSVREQGTNWTCKAPSVTQIQDWI